MKLSLMGFASVKNLFTIDLFKLTSIIDIIEMRLLLTRILRVLSVVTFDLYLRYIFKKIQNKTN